MPPTRWLGCEASRNADRAVAMLAVTSVMALVGSDANPVGATPTPHGVLSPDSGPVVTTFGDPDISAPTGIVAGADGALWFTNWRRQLDRTDLHEPGWSPITREPGSTVPGESPPAPTVPCGSRTAATTRSAGSPRPGWSPITREPGSTVPRGSPPAPTVPCGSRTPAIARSDGSPPPGSSPTTPEPVLAVPRDHRRPRRCLVVHEQRNNSIGRITTTGVVTNYTGTGITGPRAITAGPDGALWFTT